MKPGEQYQHRKTGRVCIIEAVEPTFQRPLSSKVRPGVKEKPRGYIVTYRHTDDGKRLKDQKSRFIQSYKPSEVG